VWGGRGDGVGHKKINATNHGSVYLCFLFFVFCFFVFCFLFFVFCFLFVHSCFIVRNACLIRCRISFSTCS